MSETTAAPPPTVKCKLVIAGTKTGAFRFRNGGLDQFRLDDARDLTADQARRLAEFYVQLVNEKPAK